MRLVYRGRRASVPLRGEPGFRQALPSAIFCLSAGWPHDDVDHLPLRQKLPEPNEEVWLVTHPHTTVELAGMRALFGLRPNRVSATGATGKVKALSHRLAVDHEVNRAPFGRPFGNNGHADNRLRGRRQRSNRCNRAAREQAADVIAGDGRCGT